jgi:hypothetical protein
LPDTLRATSLSIVPEQKWLRFSVQLNRVS